jgi:hypothetical protein
MRSTSTLGGSAYRFSNAPKWRSRTRNVPSFEPSAFRLLFLDVFLLSTGSSRRTSRFAAHDEHVQLLVRRGARVFLQNLHLEVIVVCAGNVGDELDELVGFVDVHRRTEETTLFRESLLGFFRNPERREDVQHAVSRRAPERTEATRGCATLCSDAGDARNSWRSRSSRMSATETVVASSFFVGVSSLSLPRLGKWRFRFFRRPRAVVTARSTARRIAAAVPTPSGPCTAPRSTGKRRGARRRRTLAGLGPAVVGARAG